MDIIICIIYIFIGVRWIFKNIRFVDYQEQI